MANYRGLVLSLVAIAGTATAAAVAYRYFTRDAHPPEPEGGNAARGNSAQDATEESAEHEAMDGDTADEYELLTEDEGEAEEEGDAQLLAQGVGAVQVQEQQLVLVAREGNMLLSVFGLIMIMLVGFVGVIVAWSSDGVSTPTELPMFPPLMWLAVGVFTAATVEVLSQSSAMAAPEEVPVLTDKTVFPHDQSDFDMIERHSARNASNDSNAPVTTPPQRQPVVRPVDHVDEAEEKHSEPPSADAAYLITQAEELFGQNKHRDTYTLLKNALSTHPTNIELLWRLARACNYLVDELTDPEQKKATAFEGLSHADKAYEVDANTAASNKWKGIMTGTVGNFRDLKEKIAGAYVIRDHIQRAVELDPQDATCHNILGQWCLAFADMTWIEKRAAAALFGTPPTATYDEAVQHFANAERISPGFWKKNVFLLAQTYYKMKQEAEARAWLLKARDVPVKTKEDEDVEKEIAALMKKLRM